MKHNTIFMYDTYTYMYNYDIKDNFLYNKVSKFHLAFRKGNIWKIGTPFGTLTSYVEKLDTLAQKHAWHAI